MIVAPRLFIERKTATLYAALEPRDFSDGAAVREQAARLRRGEPLEAALLVNAFTRPLLALRPQLGEVREAMRRAGATPALSGAGPTHYAAFTDLEEAARAAATLRQALGGQASIALSPALPPREDGRAEKASGDGPH
ncbi:MAG: hypothetical protein ACKOWF_09400 [Chloroflexota bacterium]